MDENVIPDSCAEFSAIRGFTFDFLRPFILSSRWPAMFPIFFLLVMVTGLSGVQFGL